MKRFMMLFSANRKEESIIRHFLIKILLLLFLSTPYLSASHIHYEIDHDEGCEVCVVINNFYSGDIPHSTVEIPSVEYSYDEITLYDNYRLKHLALGYYSTAPPAS